MLLLHDHSPRNTFSMVGSSSSIRLPSEKLMKSEASTILLTKHKETKHQQKTEIKATALFLQYYQLSIKSNNSHLQQQHRQPRHLRKKQFNIVIKNKTRKLSNDKWKCFIVKNNWQQLYLCKRLPLVQYDK